MLYNGYCVSKEFGMVPYECRLGTPPPFQLYPFGALVLVKLKPREPRPDKWATRLLASVLVEMILGPGGHWAKMYGVIPLRHLLGDRRPSRVYIRRAIDVIFPEQPTFSVAAEACAAWRSA